jgi:hypothetical protein
MSFSIQIASDLIIVEAGDSTPVDLTIVNRGEESDRFELQIEGLDPEWTAVPVPLFSVGAGDTQVEKVFFKPGRASESLAGNYPFVVKIRSVNSGESRQVQGVVQIKPYNHLSMDIAPKKGSISPIHGLEIFHALIMNLGNTEQTLQLYGNDAEDAFAFDFEQEQVTIGPGQQKEIEIKATPTSKRPFSSPRLHVFTISARSIQTPSLLTSSQAQLEQKPLVTPVGLILAAIILAIILFWYQARPLPPKIDSLVLEPSTGTYLAGDQVVVRWKAINATGVVLTIDDEKSNQPPEGQMSFIAKESSSVQVVALGDDKEASRPMVKSFDVKQPAVEPDPVVDEFEITPREVNVGQSILIKYRTNHALKVVLEPTATILDPNLDSYELPQTEAGNPKYWIVAESATNKTTKSRQITIKVTQASDAHVVFFDVQPRELDAGGGTVNVKWQVTDAARIQITAGGKTQEVPELTGESTVTVGADTEFYLTAFDAKGVVTRSQRVIVRVKALESPPNNLPNENPAPTTSGDQTPETTGNNNPPSPSTGGG